MKSKFKQWLISIPNEKGRLKTDTTANLYASAIEKISEHYSETSGNYIDLYNGTKVNCEKSLEIIPKYAKGGQYEKIGSTGNNTYINALKNYSNFLKYYAENEQIYAQEAVNDICIDNSFKQEQELKNTLVNQISELFPEYKLYKEKKGIEYKLSLDKRIDVLLENKENGNLLIVELKAGNASYGVLGQVAMYIELLKEKIPNKYISACIIAGNISKELRLATQITDLVELKSYHIKLELKG